MSGVTTSQRSTRSSGRGQAHVAVVEHGHAVEDHLEQDHRHHRWSQHHDGGELDEHGEDDLDGVEARPGGHVVIQVRVMHPVQAPQDRHRVHHDVLQPDDEIHGDHRDRNGKPERDLEVIEQPPALRGREGRDAHRRRGEQQPQQDCVQGYQPQVVHPAYGLGDRQRPARGQHFPQRHDGEDAEKETEADGGLVRLYERVQGLAPPLPAGLPLRGAARLY